ncbi:MAG: type II toxin-antitoxin system RelE/ParE family toxin [bacterium]
MTYELVYTKRAVRDIIRLDERTKARLKSALESFSAEPFKHAEKLVNPELGTYRFRVGSYRIIFDVDGSFIIILRVGHRRDIYRGI